MVYKQKGDEVHGKGYAGTGTALRVFAIIGLILALFGVTIIGMSPRLQPQPAAPVYSVGVLLLGDTADSSWNTAHCEGLARAADELGLRVEYEENVTPATCREAAERLIAHGCNIIVSTSIAFEPGIVQAAQAHHSISFLQATGTKVLPNLTPYMGRMYQARYLAGLVAGRTSRSGAIGYVATTDIPEVVRGIDAFTLGVRHAAPTARVYVRYTNTWANDGSAQRAKPRVAMLLLGDRGEAGWNHQQYLGASAAARRAGVDLTVIDKVASEERDAQQLLQELADEDYDFAIAASADFAPAVQGLRVADSRMEVALPKLDERACGGGRDAFG